MILSSSVSLRTVYAIYLGVAVVLNNYSFFFLYVRSETNKWKRRKQFLFLLRRKHDEPGAAGGAPLPAQGAAAAVARELGAERGDLGAPGLGALAGLRPLQRVVRHGLR